MGQKDREGARELLYLNGSMTPLAEGRVMVEDRGFLFGDGVYEVVKVVNGRLLYAPRHLARLGRSLLAIQLEGALEGHPLDEILPALVADSGVVAGSVYIQVTRGVSARDFAFPAAAEPTVLAYCREAAPASDDQAMAGTSVHPVDDLRWARCDIKSTNLLAAVLAKEEARVHGAQEVAFVGPGGVVRECGSSNIGVVIGGTVCTHPADNRILAGVTRDRVLACAQKLGIGVIERAVTVDELAGAEEVFITSTLRDVSPVVRFGGRPVGDGAPGPVTTALLGALQAEIAAEVGLSSAV